MSFSAAFSYPFKSLPKVLTIVLGYTIIIAALVSYVISNPFSPGTLILTGGLGLAEALFLTGYGIRVIRQVIEGYESLPPIEISGDVGRGILVTLSGIAHFLPLVVLLLLAGIMGVFTANGDSAIALVCLFAVIAIPVAILLSWAFMIGMARFAADQDWGVLFQVGTNFGIAKSNVGASISLTAYQIALGIVYAILTQLISSLYQNIVSPMITYNTSETTILVLVIISVVISTTLSILQQFSNLHFLAQYAEKIGILESEKSKHDEENPMRYVG